MKKNRSSPSEPLIPYQHTLLECNFGCRVLISKTKNQNLYRLIHINCQLSIIHSQDKLARLEFKHLLIPFPIFFIYLCCQPLLETTSLTSFILNANKHSVDEWWEHPTGFPKVDGSNPSSGVFPPKYSVPLAVILVHNQYHILVGARAVCYHSWRSSILLKYPGYITAEGLRWPMIVVYQPSPPLHLYRHNETTSWSGTKTWI